MIRRIETITSISAESTRRSLPGEIDVLQYRVETHKGTVLIVGTAARDWKVGDKIDLNFGGYQIGSADD